jgi:C-terminal peptidase prc
MTPQKIVPVLMAIILLAAACSPESTGPSPTTTEDAAATSTTSTNATTTTTATESTPGTTTRVDDRELELVDCPGTSNEVVIVCEAYDLIYENYVDDVDPETLAEAAELGLATLDGADSNELLVCARPADTFDSVCSTAATAADDSSEAAEAIVTGLATYGLDANSAYLDEDALDLLQEEQQGEIEGIGALVSAEDETIPGDNKQCGVISETCQISIVSTINGAPAEDAGLMQDDVIVAVGGEPIIGWTIDEVTAAVRGPSGTDVTLTLDRDGELFDVTITRAAVVIPVVESETIGDVGYVALANFGGNAASQFEEAVVDRLSDGVDTLVIDLRNNPGGFLTTAIDVASVFLEDGDVVVTEGPDESKNYPVNGDAIVPDEVQVYFVVNRGSASASEVVSATLQERDQAVIVGESTFGKNTVQQRYSLSNDGALKLTIARWLTPGGLDFGGTGVTPDVELEVNNLTPEELIEAIAEAT